MNGREIDWIFPLFIPSIEASKEFVLMFALTWDVSEARDPKLTMTDIGVLRVAGTGNLPLLASCKEFKVARKDFVNADTATKVGIMCVFQFQMKTSASSPAPLGTVAVPMQFVTLHKPRSMWDRLLFDMRTVFKAKSHLERGRNEMAAISLRFFEC